MEMSRTDCALARESVSADLDGELLELDLHRLEAHLRVCADCSAWAEHVTATTTQLRQAPVEAPAAVAFEPARRGRTWRVGPAVAAAPAAALVAAIAVALGGAHGSLGGQSTTGPNPSPAGQHAVDNGPDVNVYLAPTKHWAIHAI